MSNLTTAALLPPTLYPNTTTFHPKHLPLTSGWRKGVGVVICITGNILISVALNIQKSVHRKLEGSNKDYCLNCLWWVGLAIIAVGELGNFGAYGFAPASVVAPLGSMGVISNAFIAVLFMKERLRLRDVVGVVWVLVGAYLLVAYSATDDPVIDFKKIIHYLSQVSLWVFLVIEVLLYIGIAILHRDEKHVSAITMCLQVALLGSPTVIAAKAVSSMISVSIWVELQLNSYIFWVMSGCLIISVVAQIRHLNAAMKLYDSSVIMPVYFVFFTIVAVASAIMFYQELWHLKALQVAMSMLGAALSFGGVYMISGGREAKEEEEKEKGRGEEEEGLLGGVCEGEEETEEEEEEYTKK